jgi:glycosyltransferase involved in cell wall biosynthesis
MARPATRAGHDDVKNLLIIPAYNEEAALPKTVARLQGLSAGFEAVIVNDGSRDRTGTVAEELAQTSRLPLHVVHLPVNGGIGVAVQTGYLFAAQRGHYTYVIQFDADGQHDPGALEQLVATCEAQRLDLCIGSRFLAHDGYRSTFLRRLGIKFLAMLISRLSGVRITDPTSGLRCAGPRAWKWFARNFPEDYPEPESLFWCARNRFRIGEIPTHMHARQGGVSSIRYAHILYYMLKVSTAIVLDRFRGREE